MKRNSNIWFYLPVIFIWTSVALAQDEPSIHGTKQADPVFQDSAGLAARGHDPVAYFLEKRPVKGKEEFSYRWMGAIWRFSSAANRERFVADPGKYAPQFGGYCAYGMASGYAAPIDPAAWTIVGGKLYLNYSLEVRDLWTQGMGRFIAKANQNWPKIPKKPLTD